MWYTQQDKGNKDNEEGIKGGMKGGLYNVG